jgi:HSP20 family molecular chaperone IbpA
MKIKKLEAEFGASQQGIGGRPREEAVVKQPKADSLMLDLMTRGHLLIDVYHDTETITIESAIAGVESDDLDISITSRISYIKGSREHKEKVHKNDFCIRSVLGKVFPRSVILPQEIDP